MTVAIAVINIALFALSGALASFTLSLGVGFALFAVISILRLRSDEAGWIEMAYLLTGLSVGLVLGLPGYSLLIQAIYAVILVFAIFVIDSPRVLSRAKSKNLVLNVNFKETDPKELRNKVAEELNREIISIEIKSVTLEPASMKLEVRYSEK